MTPQEIAAVRPLIEWARANGYTHEIYQVNDAPVEHNWRTLGREHEVALFDGCLYYKRQGALLMTAVLDEPDTLGSIGVAADLLAIYGIGGALRQVAEGREVAS